MHSEDGQNTENCPLLYILVVIQTLIQDTKNPQVKTLTTMKVTTRNNWL